MVFVNSKVKTVTKNNVSFKVSDSDIFRVGDSYDFWEQYHYWEENTFKIFDKFLNKNKSFLDIGAWIGATGIYASYKCKQVVCVEPDPVAYEFLLENISLNNITNITSYNKALSYDYDIFLSEVNFLGSSMTRCSRKDSGMRVDCTNLDNLLLEEDFCFIKMDIEGYESECIPHMTDVLKINKIPLYISFHESFFSNNNIKVKDLILMLDFYDNIVDDNLDQIDINNINGFGSYLFF